MHPAPCTVVPLEKAPGVTCGHTQLEGRRGSYFRLAAVTSTPRERPDTRNDSHRRGTRRGRVPSGRPRLFFPAEAELCPALGSGSAS